jgi:hypothetical protein
VGEVKARSGVTLLMASSRQFLSSVKLELSTTGLFSSRVGSKKLRKASCSLPNGRTHVGYELRLFHDAMVLLANGKEIVLLRDSWSLKLAQLKLIRFRGRRHGFIQVTIRH